MILETERLILRKMTQEDYPALCRMLQDPLCMYAYEHAFSDEEAQAWLDRQLTRYREDGFGPVLGDYDQIRSALLRYLADPRMEPLYQQRAKDFFYEPATSRCQEVVEALRAL